MFCIEMLRPNKSNAVVSSGSLALMMNGLSTDEIATTAVSVSDRRKKTPDKELTKRIVDEAFQRGLCLIAPIGLYGNVIRIAPPLVMTEAQLNEGLDILEAAMKAAVS